MTDDLEKEQFTYKSFVPYKYPYWGPFIMQAELDDKEIKELLDRGNRMREMDLNYTEQLAGDLDNEYYHVDIESWFPQLFGKYIDAYIDGLMNLWQVPIGEGSNPSHAADEDKNEGLNRVGWTMHSLWINYMQARDFNPPHNHSGDLSFVIYLDVPKELKEEYDNNKHIHNNGGPGAIQFTWGEEQYLSISNRTYFPETGMVLIFPAWLKHFVIGYRSEVERVSVSGNIHLNVS